MREIKDHQLVSDYEFRTIRYERRPLLDGSDDPIPGLWNAWIVLDNPKQLNSYTTDMVKEVILAFRRASVERDVVAAVFTAVGERAFCTGGNTAEYAEVYSGRPLEYRQYMRLFNDMVTSILECDKPVINRVNGMRLAGGQEIGMACDFTLAADTAVFGQAGPKHGSAPDGGSTDFLPLYVGFAHAMESCTLCDVWTAYQAVRLGLINEVVPVLVDDGRLITDPRVVTDRWLDDTGRIVYGERRRGDALEAAQRIVDRCEVDHAELDRRVERLAWKLANTVPDCTTKTIESLRKHKLAHWHRNRESNRAWLALNMVTEAKAGFRAFHYGERGEREVDFLQLRRLLAEGREWNDELVAEITPEGAEARRARQTHPTASKVGES
ncbi:MAG: 6-oxocyclohex-1-ene-1-carbonyl-CoA hydratase [Thermoanaerobaculia bacterium]|nr:6-oxocyclohex-1-ene-1-carbonyl-CoA hydratase [Thermoanaerobaculia bacterium]